MRIGWLTDLHLNFVPARKRSIFYAQLRERNLDAILLGGDMAEIESERSRCGGAPGESTALIGHDSWADGRLGDFFRSSVQLNDYLLISELRDKAQRERYAQTQRVGGRGRRIPGTTGV